MPILNGRVVGVLLVATALLTGCDTTAAPASPTAPPPVRQATAPAQGATTAPELPTNAGPPLATPGLAYPGAAPPEPTYDPYAAPAQPASTTTP